MPSDETNVQDLLSQLADALDAHDLLVVVGTAAIEDDTDEFTGYGISAWRLSRTDVTDIEMLQMAMMDMGLDIAEGPVN